MSVDLLILGAGWISTFLIPLCKDRNISFEATTRSGSNNTIQFQFDPNSDDSEPFQVLPDAKTVLISFPITILGASERLVRLYKSTRKDKEGLKPQFVQLGATSIWGELGSSSRRRDTTEPVKPAENNWYDRHSPHNPNERSDAEDELLSLSPATPTTVLDLAGLWGGTRSMKNYVGRVAPTKEVLKNKGSLHMIHGIDVSRAILAIHSDFSKSTGQRWILTDGRVYDWWDLASAWGSGPTSSSGSDAASDNSTLNPSSDNVHNPDPEDRGPQARWVRELMRETGVRALPRSNDTLGRALDSREFWETYDLSPLKARMEG